VAKKIYYDCRAMQVAFVRHGNVFAPTQPGTGLEQQALADFNVQEPVPHGGPGSSREVGAAKRPLHLLLRFASLRSLPKSVAQNLLHLGLPGVVGRFSATPRPTLWHER